jgi:hypothetical protein
MSDNNQQPIILDTPEQINAWYVLSMYSRLRMQERGLKTPGLIRVLKERGYITKSTAKAAIPEFEAYMDSVGIDYSRFKR